MANKRNTPAADLFEVPTLEEFEINQFFDEIAPGVSIIHFHRLYNDGRRPQIGKALLDVIKEDVYEYIRSTFIAKYGGGKYLLIARGDGGKFISSRVLEVDGGVGETPGSGPHSATNGAAGGSENLSFHDKLLLYNFIGGQKQQIDIGAIMAGLASMMMAMKPADKPLDPLAMFQSMMELYKSNKPPEKNSLQEIREVASVIKEFSGDGGKEVDSMWGAVANIGKDAVDKLAPILTGITVGGRQPSAPVPAAPVIRQPIPQIPARSPMIPPGTVVAGAPAAPVASPLVEAKPPEGELSAEDNLRRWLTVQIGFLKEKCAKVNKNPEFWAEYIFENEEEPGCSALLYAVRQGATLDNLLAFDLEIAQTPQLTWWFSQLYEHVKLGLQDDLDPGGPGGHPGDDSRNAAPVPTGPTRAGSNGAGGAIPDTDIH